MSDIRAVSAREAHRLSGQAGQLAAQHRQRRDDLIRALRAENPTYWTYPRLATAVGCSPELVAAIIKQRTRQCPA